MANRLVSVDDSLRLPPAVRAQLSADVTEDLEPLITAAETASTQAQTAATTATEAADEAVAAAETVTIPTDEMVDQRIGVAIDDGVILSAEDTDLHIAAAVSSAIEVADSHTVAYVTDRLRTNIEVHNRVRASCTVKFSSADMYTVIRVATGGQFIPGLVRKAYPDGYVGPNPGTPVTNFLPPAKDILSYVEKDTGGAPVLFNASGYNVGGRVYGLQIANGVVYADFQNISGGRGYDALCFHADGTAKIYSSRFGDTAASAKAAGVVDSFGFGPALVTNGVVSTTANHPGMAEWEPVSGRQALGVSQTGEIILITTYGVSGSTGISGSTLAQRMRNEGAWNAIMLDGGGSAQTVVNGYRAMRSSDAGAVRESPDVGFINVPSINDFDTGWRAISSSTGSLVSGFTSTAGRDVRIRRVRNRIDFTGRLTASTNITNAWVTVMNLSNFWSPNFNYTAPIGLADANGNANPGLATFLSAGTALQIRGNTGATSPWIDLNGLGWYHD